MKNEITVNEKVLEFEEPSMSRFEEFKSIISRKTAAGATLQGFLEKAQNGDILNIKGLGQRIEDAIEEVFGIMKETANIFFDILLEGKARYNGTILDRAIFDSMYDFDSVDDVKKLFESIYDFLNIGPTDIEVKN